MYEGVNGGCTAVVCLFLLGKVYICNAGDSRAILCQRNQDAVALSDDFTPESERTRIRQLVICIIERVAEVILLRILLTILFAYRLMITPVCWEVNLHRWNSFGGQ